MYLIEKIRKLISKRKVLDVGTDDLGVKTALLDHQWAYSARIESIRL